jgi:hypothetical protein
MSEQKSKAAVRITTIEGHRSVTKGTATIAQYGKKRRSLLSGKTKLGKSRFA